MKRLWIVPVVLAAVALLAVPAADLYYKSSWGGGCARCHEIGPQYDAWQHSAHRTINCVECHASSTATNVRRVATHLRGEVPAQVHLRAEDVVAMLPRCRKCHQQEFAQWSTGPHSMTYAKAFFDKEHNRKQPLMDDCLRCHGMHFDGGIGEIIKQPGSRPAIPCLSCHAVHRQGAPLIKPDLRVGSRQEIARPSLGFFDRRTRVHVAAAALPIPVVYDRDRRVKMSPDPRQSICYQCHAPESAMQAGTGDDRTPLGVHEGLSCLACHQKHGQATRQSCADCHPRLSNCGLDVEKMDTTFRDPKSAHNVHTVKCLDCHPKGPPPKRVVKDAGTSSGPRG
jgi:hypothetical protein